MKTTLCAFLLFSANIASSESTAMPPSFDIAAAERFAKLALACVHQEYPNKISHSLNSDADVAAPRKLTPAFYAGLKAGKSPSDALRDAKRGLLHGADELMRFPFYWAPTVIFGDGASRLAKP